MLEIYFIAISCLVVVLFYYAGISVDVFEAFIMKLGFHVCCKGHATQSPLISRRLAHDPPPGSLHWWQRWDI